VIPRGATSAPRIDHPVLAPAATADDVAIATGSF
jgi:hypothetical protein